MSHNRFSKTHIGRAGGPCGLNVSARHGSQRCRGGSGRAVRSQPNCQLLDDSSHTLLLLPTTFLHGSNSAVLDLFSQSHTSFRRPAALHLARVTSCVEFVSFARSSRLNSGLPHTGNASSNGERRQPCCYPRGDKEPRTS